MKCLDAEGRRGTIYEGGSYTVGGYGGASGSLIRLDGVDGVFSPTRFVLESRPAPALGQKPIQAHDPISPAHYARYKIEPITFIIENKLPYAVGNVVKYVCRFDAKNGLEDLRKAKRYVEYLIEEAERGAA